MLARCDTVPLQTGQVLGVGRPVFLIPLSRIVSIIACNADGYETEIAAVGIDGFVDTDLAGQRASLEARVTVSGQALQLATSEFHDLVRNDKELAQMEVLSMRTLFLKTVRGRVCGQYHLSTGRVASYLLGAARLVAGPLPFTHEQIARALGLGRPTVTGSMMELYELGAIDRRRGHITIMDEDRLVSSACACMQPNRAIG